MATRQDDEAELAAQEMRAAPRFTLMLRAAKLATDEGEFLCVLRDVSASGFKAKLFHPLPDAGRFELELGSGERFIVEPVWERDGHAGFRFVGGPIDVHALVEEAGPFPKRHIRLALDLPVLIEAGGLRHSAVLRNLSQHGALIEIEPGLALGQLVCFKAKGLPELDGRVRWRRGKAHGLVFQQGFRLDQLAELAARLQLAPGQAAPAISRAS